MKSSPVRTMADLARLAKCSPMTVSLALRGSPRVSEKVTLKIQALAQKHAYRPNPLVSALSATRRRKQAFQATVAFMTHFESRTGWQARFPAYKSLQEGVRARAESLGYAVEEVWMRDPEMPVPRMQKIMEARGIQGMIIAPLLADGSTLPNFDWERFSVVAIGYSVREPGFHRVSHDYFHGMMTALAHGRALGYRRIGFFVDRRVNQVLFNLWLAAFLAEQRTTPQAEVVEPLLMAPGEESALLAWAKAERLDAVVGLDTWNLETRGMALPKKIARIALNADDGPASYRGISRDFTFLGGAAMDRLVALLHGNERGPRPRPQTTLVEGVWVAG